MLLSDSDRTAIADTLASVRDPVRLVFFEQSIGCEKCAPTRQLLEQLTELSPHVTLETRNLVLDKESAEQYRVDRVPAIVVASAGRDRIRFYGAPFGNELMSLVEAIKVTGTGDTHLSEQSRAQLSTLSEPVRIQIFFTPTCAYCPQMVSLANRLAVQSRLVEATAIDATEYPDLVRRYRVNGVPKTIINDRIEIVGLAPEEELVTAIC